MASVPHFYSGYPFSDEYSNFPNTLQLVQENYGGSWGEENLPLFLDNGGFDVLQAPKYNVTSPVPATLVPEIIGMSDLAVPVALPDNNIVDGRLCGDIGGIPNTGVSRYPLSPESMEFGEECQGFLQDFKPVHDRPVSSETWGGIDYKCNRVPVIEDNSLKIGRYSVEERKDRILRYLKKRNQRNFNKTIKYACRKTLADRRVRIRGRFARNTELCEGEMVMKKEGHTQHNEKDLCYGTNVVQMKEDEEDCWLQEAMANLMYLPYISG
ncbi:hypothetical protein SLE2022_343100 [Rubroshorea leprosula]